VSDVAHGFDSAVEAALAGAPAEARILDVSLDGNTATVHAEVNRSTGYDVWIYCERRNGRWFDVGHRG
jgi:hypothetical protein